MLALAAVLSLGAGLAARHWLAPPPVPLPSAPVAAAAAAAPAEPRLVDLDGRPRTLAEWQGRVLVLNFWASWCGPCREEMPEFVRLQAELGDQGLQFVGVAIDEPAAVREFLKETPVNYPILIGDEHAPDWADRLGNSMGGLPFTVVFDRAGRSVHAQLGVLRRDSLLERVRPLLGPSISESKR
jgi:thiol-disulfide isomerase/thioredoxin